jgi:hypothetical protein
MPVNGRNDDFPHVAMLVEWRRTGRTAQGQLGMPRFDAVAQYWGSGSMRRVSRGCSHEAGKVSTQVRRHCGGAWFGGRSGVAAALSGAGKG